LPPAVELELPIVRADAARLAEIAAREHHSHLAYSAEILAGEIDDPASRRHARRIGEARFPYLERLADFNADLIRASPPNSPPSPPVRGSTPASWLSPSATPAPARRTCSSVWAWAPASKDARSVTPPSRPW
jgi:hypothetical protein